MRTVARIGTLVPLACAALVALLMLPPGGAAPVHPAAVASGSWTSLFPNAGSTGVGRLGNPGMAYDAADGYAVLFGGQRSATFGSYTINDTWTYANGTWTNISATAGGPSPRSVSDAMVYDAADGYIVLFGGEDSYGGSYGDTWTFSAGHWTQLALNASNSPSSRIFAAMTYDAAMRSVILFGGSSNDLIGSGFYNDTWAFAHGTWTKFTTPVAPSLRRGAMLAYDPGTKSDILFGGLNTAGGPIGVTWSFHNGTWTKLAATGPSSRYLSAFAYDPIHHGEVLFGGCTALSCATTTGTTWLFKAGTWYNASAGFHLGARNPPALGSVGATYDPASQQLLVFGGHSASAGTSNSPTYYSPSLWVLKYQWANLNPIPAWAGPARLGNAGWVWDAADNYSLLFGGQRSVSGYSYTVNETWSFNGTSWQNLSGSIGAAPSPRTVQGQMAYDARDGYVVLFGGEDSYGGSLGGTWTYSGGHWSSLSKLTTYPGDRIFGAMAYDNSTQSVILYGGSTSDALGTGFYSDTWAFANGSWKQLHPTASPPALRGAMMTYDPSMGALVLFGGLDVYGNPTSGTYEFANNTWTLLNTSGPSASFLGAFAYDAKYGGDLLYGGCSAPGCVSGVGGTWFLIHGKWHAGEKYFGFSSQPPARGSMVGVYDPNTQLFMMYGGHKTATYILNNVGYYVAATWAFG